MQTRHQLTIAVLGLAGGAICFAVPPALAVPVLGLQLLTVGGGVALYHNSPALRQALSRVATRTQRLLAEGPRPRPQIAAPSRPEDVLASLLADSLPSTGETRPVRRAATPPTTRRLPSTERLSVETPRALLITNHPELLERWAEARSAVRASGHLDRPLGEALAELADALGACQVRVAADVAALGGTDPAAALIVLDAPLSIEQEQTLTRWGGWWRPYASGRLQGVQVVLGGAPASEVMPPPARGAGQLPDLPDEEPALPAQAALAPAPPLPRAIAPRPAPRPAPELVWTPRARLANQRQGIADVVVQLGLDVATGEPLEATLKHGIIANMTGGGKTNLVYLLLGQLRALGDAVDIWYGTGKPFVPIDPKDVSRFDRRPVVAGLREDRVALNPNDLLLWLHRVMQHMEACYKRMQEEPGWFALPTIVILDEGKAFTDMMRNTRVTVGKKEVPAGPLAEHYLRQILMLARESGMGFLFTSQDGYCGSVGLTRGELMNLGLRMVHPEMDRNTLGNLVPEWSPGPFDQPGRWDWLCAAGGEVRLVRVPKVTARMFADWGLAAPVPVEPEVEDAALLRWVIARSRGGEPVTVEGAAEHFAVPVPVMREAMRRNELLEA